MSTSVLRDKHTQTVHLHAEAAFTVRELGLYPVKGAIPVTHAEVHVDAAGRPLRVEATLDPAGIDTGHQRRDAHLRSERFLDVEHHPTMTFVGDEVSAAGNGWTVAGALEVRGVSRAAILRVNTADPADASGAFVGTTKLDRRGFGIDGIPSVLIANTVTVTIRASTVPATR